MPVPGARKGCPRSAHQKFRSGHVPARCHLSVGGLVWQEAGGARNVAGCRGEWVDRPHRLPLVERQADVGEGPCRETPQRARCGPRQLAVPALSAGRGETLCVVAQPKVCPSCSYVPERPSARGIVARTHSVSVRAAMSRSLAPDCSRTDP